MSKGIDYGLGRTNIDVKTGIRYGVIAINSLNEWIWESLEADYGEAQCPECASTVIESEHGKDYFCWDCWDCNGSKQGHERLYTHWSDRCFGDEPLGHSLSENGIEAHSAFNQTCLFVTASPFYTFAAFCSPCAPGAGNLDSSCEDGAKTFCLPADYFDDERCPYPVYRVSDDSLVTPASIVN